MDDSVTFELQGARELARELARFPDRVAKRAADRGIRRTAVQLRREFRAAAPIGTGHLRSAITFRYYPRSGRAVIGLGKSGKKFAGSSGRRGVPFYYKTLEFHTARGPALRPFFEHTWNKVRMSTARNLIREVKHALYFEAGKEYQRSLARMRRGR